jgi:hypothetical protein
MVECSKERQIFVERYEILERFLNDLCMEDKVKKKEEL